MKDDTVDQMLNDEALKEAKCDHSKCKSGTAYLLAHKKIETLAANLMPC